MDLKNYIFLLMDPTYANDLFEDRKNVRRNHTNRALDPESQFLNLTNGAFSKNFLP